MFRHPEIARLVRVGSLVHAHGWAEGNAGNMSVRLGGRFRAPKPARGAPAVALPMAFPALAGARLLVTATGGRMRDLERDPEAGLLLVEVLDGGRSWRRRWGRGRPTSEFLCHLAVHAQCAAARPGRRAVLHVHAPQLMALSHVLAGADFVRAIERIHPEGAVLLGNCGLAFVDFLVGGSPELARATGRAVRRADLAMWQFHGLVSVAADLEAALDQAEMAERGAGLILLARAAGVEPRGLSDGQLAAVRAAFCRKE